ncbi:rhodanese-like domain-containing protein [Chitinophaga qingshengii]|uniref:Rhodanese-like domain-containing protein n=1 Tax=Chitinophaga qingshengii TaxID=1569794 RepID=A0ABR7TF99_9BACT|nr:rhodanese-like domain-containing protein [Chitinophaga qingshengii]MBC9929001.1 rhodanese-like domain-containing protein [Chitinophaga qingshengii]
MKTWLIIAGALLLIYMGYRVYRFYTLDKGLDKLVAAGAVILDVRTPSEFNMGHIAGAINISLGEIRQRYTELDTAKTYITVCSHGLRSVKAEKLLKERGFKRVYNGGAWSDFQEYLHKHKKIRH